MIETERLLLRGWREEDIEPYARMCADPEVMRFVGDGSTLGREQSGGQIARFVRHRQEHGFGPWAAEEKAGLTLRGEIPRKLKAVEDGVLKVKAVRPERADSGGEAGAR